MADNKDKKVLNVPALRFPEFTDEWKEVLFASNLERLENGATYNTNDKDGVPMSRIETISTGRIDYTKVGHCSTPQKIEHYIMRYGDILFSHINSLKHIGKTAYYSAEEPLYHGMNLLLFRCKNNVDSKFFFFLINNTHFIRKCQILAKQAVNQASISTSDLKKIKVYIPDINEQSKIQKFLSLIEKRIELQNKIIEKLETLIKGIVEKTFVSSQYVTLQHYSPIITSGKDQNSGGNYPLYGSTGVIGSVLNPSYNKPIVLIARVGSIGNVQYVTAPCGISDNTLIIDAGEDNRFIYYYLNGYNFSHIISGTTQPLITASSVKKIEIPVIEKHRRKKIVSTLYAIEQKLRNEKYIAYLLSRQKYFLLSQMFI